MARAWARPAVYIAVAALVALALQTLVLAGDATPMQGFEALWAPPESSQSPWTLLSTPEGHESFDEGGDEGWARLVIYSMPDALVTVKGEGVEKLLTVPGNGVLEVTLPPGEYEISLVTSDGSMHRERVTLQPGASQSIVILPMPGPTPRFKENATPAPGTTVTVAEGVVEEVITSQPAPSDVEPEAVVLPAPDDLVGLVYRLFTSETLYTLVIAMTIAALATIAYRYLHEPPTPRERVGEGSPKAPGRTSTTNLGEARVSGILGRRLDGVSGEPACKGFLQDDATLLSGSPGARGGVVLLQVRLWRLGLRLQVH